MLCCCIISTAATALPANPDETQNTLLHRWRGLLVLVPRSAAVENFSCFDHIDRQESATNSSGHQNQHAVTKKQTAWHQQQQQQILMQQMDTV